MLVVSFKMTRARISIALFCVVAVLITMTAIADSIKGTTVMGKNLVKVSTNEDRVNFLEGQGWEVVAEPKEIVDVSIPETFDEVYSKYNELQKKQGLDLYKYKGQTIKRYTYEVTNYPDENALGVIANILVYNDKVIGGDICSTEASGFMHGLESLESVISLLSADEPAVSSSASEGSESEYSGTSSVSVVLEPVTENE